MAVGAAQQATVLRPELSVYANVNGACPTRVDARGMDDHKPFTNQERLRSREPIGASANVMPLGGFRQRPADARLAGSVSDGTGGGPSERG